MWRSSSRSSRRPVARRPRSSRLRYVDTNSISHCHCCMARGKRLTIRFHPATAGPRRLSWVRCDAPLGSSVPVSMAVLRIGSKQRYIADHSHTHLSPERPTACCIRGASCVRRDERSFTSPAVRYPPPPPALAHAQAVHAVSSPSAGHRSGAHQALRRASKLKCFLRQTHECP